MGRVNLKSEARAAHEQIAGTFAVRACFIAVISGCSIVRTFGPIGGSFESRNCDRLKQLSGFDLRPAVLRRCRKSVRVRYSTSARGKSVECAQTIYELSNARYAKQDRGLSFG